MADNERCDVAVWDVSGGLLGETRRQLRNTLRRDGPRIAIETGDWLQKRIAIAWPQRAIASHAPSIAEALAALVAAHRPERLVVVGPATAIDRSLAVGSVLIADEVVSSHGAERLTLPAIATADLPSGVVGVGQLAVAETGARVTTDWAGVAAEAITDLGVDAVLVTVVTARANGVLAEPPRSRRPTASRQAGRLLGKLFKGDWSMHSNDAASSAVAGAIRALLGSPHRDSPSR
ncbi:Phosphorylase superfamily protein [Botrimarina colliarenosi]|uniref:Phosphorylase superfamily protein n=1 Tax=Botrimarina colliarenosi TaxID=2528001 RepID=A0A5C6AHU6_9BACT|nr:hypothetical protein [Botrimarina colliarenosi]TWT99209.1 Phosphorylase superfamily protein [Botrimarina colliarenosi]